MSTCPLLASSNRASSRTTVDLPDAVEPTIAVVVPGWTVKLTSARTRASASGYTKVTSRISTVPGAGKVSTASEEEVMVGGVASTSLMRSAHTAARGIMIVMKLAMTMPMRICMR